MSGVFPPVVPIPGDDWRRYPSPLPGEHAPSTAHDQTGGPAASEEGEIRRREGQADLIDVLTAERDQIRRAYAEAANPGTPVERRTDLTDVLVAELSRQVAVERRFLVPLVRDHLADPDADRLLSELAELEQAAERLQTHPAGADTDDLGTRLAGLDADRRQRLYPALRAACDRQRLHEAGQRARAARHTAPTRPHRRIPEGPRWSALTDPVVGATDRLRDELTGRPTEPRDLR